MPPPPRPTPWPITGTLDLHLFQPREVDDLVPEYLAECRKRGILQVRIIHGKGTGQLRERVHAVLRCALNDRGQKGDELVDIIQQSQKSNDFWNDLDQMRRKVLSHYGADLSDSHSRTVYEFIRSLAVTDDKGAC